MYVPILAMIQELFKNTDILDKITESGTASGQYASDGSYFLENDLSTGDLILPLQLYILMTLKLPICLVHHVKFTKFVLYIGSLLMCRQNTDQYYMLYSLQCW